MDDKHEVIDSASSVVNSKTADDALVFLQEHQDIETSAAQVPSYVRKLRRKVDFYVISFLTICYTLNFLDKVLYNYANVMGISRSLHLTGNDFSNAASAFYIADTVAGVPNTFLLQLLPTGKWLSICLLCWGISTSCHAALQNYDGLLTVRVLSGLFESCVPSACMLLSSQYFARREQATRFSIWYTGLGFGQILGGLISFAFQHVTGSFEGWRIMFLAVGVFTVVFSIGVFFLVPDTPMKAWFLTDEEKVILLQHVKANQTGIENARIQPKQIWEGLTDFQIWAVGATLLLQGTGGGVVTTYSSTLVASFGFTPKIAALLLMPTGVVSIAAALFAGIGSRYYGHRWAFSLFVAAIGIAGAAMLAYIPHGNRAGLLASIYLVNSLTGAGPTEYQWVLGNTAGHTKRAFFSAMLNSAFTIGNIVGPLTFKASERPTYHTAKVSLVGTWSASAGGILALVVYYVLVNRHRNRKAGPGAETNDTSDVADSKAFAGLTDKQNPAFRYQY
ncbi:hypothetical protein PRZ48_007646 [Zasmidium cellare]|uniref:Major facilitator superfamily (MFS) profile domain-containing protein n=1 Tax=Zasmidium cellare TaxID=395010 RepID=A0ABR0EK33_ZASCE|nr:hypothetical protein PRZ48_007646 [Zasmidium cellare]